jgi:hypothetical protein
MSENGTIGYYEDPYARRSGQTVPFSMAFCAMVDHGAAIKRIGWVGYWRLGKHGLEMHLKDGTVKVSDFDIMKTLDNCCCHDWYVLTPEELKNINETLSYIHAM